MPPKKKRLTPNQVALPIPKVSTTTTRSGRVVKPKSETLDAILKPPSLKPLPKKNKPPTKSRVRKFLPKKKPKDALEIAVEPAEITSEVQVESDRSEVGTSTEVSENETVTTEGEIFSSEIEAEALVPEILKVEEVTMEEMEVAEIKTFDSETCQISKQLEDLHVIPEELVDESIVQDVVDDSSGGVDIVNIEEQVIEYEEVAVEYITEDFFPIVDNTEVVIEEEPEKSDLETAQNNVEINLELMHQDNDTEQRVSEVVQQPVIEDESKGPISVDEVKIEEILLDAESVKPEKPRKKKTVKKDMKKTQSKKRSKPVKKEQDFDKTEEVRRSSRIKSITVQKQRCKGRGLVKQTKVSNLEPIVDPAPLVTDLEKTVEAPMVPQPEPDNKPVKVKSRWRRSSELEMNVLTPAAVVMETCGDSVKIAEANAILMEKDKLPNKDEEVKTRLKQFVHLKENLYLTDRMTCKEAKKMSCDCFLTPEEIERKEFGCGEDCLNRLLMIECGNFCPVEDRCTNKKFQKCQFAPVEVFKTEKKGLGLRAAANIPYGDFILEYVGEVLDHEEFNARADDYSNDKNRHYYFMALRADAIIDATMKGNISRFINHSCDPNAETQKWTVNGELRIGFFSTRTILAGEEITFDYRFQRYGKEAQKCFCEAPTCRGWLGEEPDDDDEEEEEEEDEDEETEGELSVKEDTEIKSAEIEAESTEITTVKTEVEVEKPIKKEKKKRLPKKKPRKDIFDDVDQLDEEIDMLLTTGLKNQAHTLKLSRLMVRAKEPAQRTKLLRILRRGELPCRRLFLDYHGLRLMHGYMTDALHLAKTDKQFESLRLEMLQTLATLPIPNKTMLQDSKVLPTVEVWSMKQSDDMLLDSDSSSPQTDQEPSQTPTQEVSKKEDIVTSDEAKATPEELEIRKTVSMDYEAVISENVGFTNSQGKELADEIADIFQEEVESLSVPLKETKSEAPNYEEEIIALALKLLEEWASLKEVFKIPKKERIEQMKEHEREANRGYIAGLAGLDNDTEKRSESRYRILKRYRSIDKIDSCSLRKNVKIEERTIVNFPKLGKHERRKMFALQVEQREEERRRKQREMWRQHEQHCILLGTDPRLTAPFDPNRGYQCIWNPQIGQWQNYPLQNPNLVFNQNPNPMVALPPNPNFPYIHPGVIPGNVNSIPSLPNLPYQEEVKKPEDYSEVKFMGPIPPPAKLPPKWKTAKDKYGRPYYYHVKIRKSQWEPPPLPKPQGEPDDSSETTSSSDTSSLSSDSSSEDSESDEDLDDSKLLMDVRKQMEKQAKLSFSKTLSAYVKNEENNTPSPADEEKPEKEKTEENLQNEESEEGATSIVPKLQEVVKEEKPQPQATSKKRRAGLVHEIIISPRTEEDRLQFREDLKRYKQNKETLKREKELMGQQTKKPLKEKRNRATVKAKMREMKEDNNETAKRIKETFRSNMATVVVGVLNIYRKPDCKEGRITNTDDFKHLARKLTHFVMLKEMKHIEKIEDLVCTENVKTKAREYIKKYMSKFGENYQKRNDEPDF